MAIFVPSVPTRQRDNGSANAANVMAILRQWAEMGHMIRSAVVDHEDMRSPTSNDCPALVHAMGYRYRLHVTSLPGNPDLVFPRLRKALFVSGCFWHMHG